ncbi:hypothetical protein D3C76_1157320 [compost metagenome]
MLVVLVEQFGGAGAAALAAVFVAQQVLVGDDVGPVVAAGVVHAEQYLAEARQRGQRLDGLRRHCRDAEHHHATRQGFRTLDGGGEAVQETPVHPGAAAGQPIGADFVDQRPPQLGLPAVIHIQLAHRAAGQAQLVAALAPVLQPVGAINLVLVEQVGQALGQLVALAQVGVVGEEALQGLELLALQQGW